mmetsp:Transcript_10341/g.29538  ORF Transcript_10341/g.29538 Transcript_10341/m.29538 type:complete len:236 (+) Transcript_10341:1358-2065(+)
MLNSADPNCCRAASLMLRMHVNRISRALHGGLEGDCMSCSMRGRSLCEIERGASGKCSTPEKKVGRSFLACETCCSCFSFIAEQDVMNISRGMRCCVTASIKCLQYVLPGSRRSGKGSIARLMFKRCSWWFLRTSLAISWSASSPLFFQSIDVRDRWSPQAKRILLLASLIMVLFSPKLRHVKVRFCLRPVANASAWSGFTSVKPMDWSSSVAMHGLFVRSCPRAKRTRESLDLL